MSDTWLRAEPLWFGVHLAPEHGFLPETKQAAKKADGLLPRDDERDASSGDDATETDGGDAGDRKRRRSVSAERRRKALARRKKSAEE